MKPVLPRFFGQEMPSANQQIDPISPKIMISPISGPSSFTSGPESSLFGAQQKSTPVGLFGSSQAVPKRDPFGAPLFASSQAVPKGPGFGAQAPQQINPEISLFGAPQKSNPVGLFVPQAVPKGPALGAQAPQQSNPGSSLFGAQQKSTPVGLFGSSQAVPKRDPFGAPLFASSQAVPKGPGFGAQAPQQINPGISLFGAPQKSNPVGLFVPQAVPKGPSLGAQAPQQSNPGNSLFGALSSKPVGLFAPQAVPKGPALGAQAPKQSNPVSSLFGGSSVPAKRVSLFDVTPNGTPPVGPATGGLFGPPPK